MKVVLKITAGILLALVVTVAGCGALVGGAANQVQKESNKHAITMKQYESVKGNALKSDVIRKLGKPASRNSVSLDVGDTPYGESCVYYNIKDQILSGAQFCFDQKDNRLVSKVSV